jgi:hypothetical protein
LVEYDVTVSDDGSGVQDVFYLNGTPLKDNQGAIFNLTFTTNTRYRFNLSDPSNGAFKFSTTPDTNVPATVTDYIEGVTVSGTPGSANSYVEIVITDETPSPLYFWTPDIVSPSRDGTLIGAAQPIHIAGRTKPNQEINNGDEIDLNLGVSYFSTSTAETATLADGVNGQTKTLIMTSDGGNMVVTVDSAGWKENTGDPAQPQSGTITFNTVGQSCQLQFLNAKWYCIGNNGATFA